MRLILATQTACRTRAIAVTLRSPTTTSTLTAAKARRCLRQVGLMRKASSSERRIDNVVRPRLI
jgi:hypothetical protein